MRRATIILGASALALATAPAALASANGYEGRGGTVQVQVEAGGALPFTGLDLVFVVVASAALVLAGFAVRRFARSRG